MGQNVTGPIITWRIVMGAKRYGRVVTGQNLRELPTTILKRALALVLKVENGENMQK